MWMEQKKFFLPRMDDEVEQIEGSEANFEVAEDDFDESFGEDMEEYDEGYDPAEEE